MDIYNKTEGHQQNIGICKSRKMQSISQCAKWSVRGRCDSNAMGKCDPHSRYNSAKIFISEPAFGIMRTIRIGSRSLSTLVTNDPHCEIRTYLQTRWLLRDEHRDLFRTFPNCRWPGWRLWRSLLLRIAPCVNCSRETFIAVMIWISALLRYARAGSSVQTRRPQLSMSKTHLCIIPNRDNRRG